MLLGQVAGAWKGEARTDCVARFNALLEYNYSEQNGVS